MKIKLYWGSADCAAHYCGQDLDEADRRRLALRPQLAQRTGWRISRYLKTYLEDGRCCLSHSGSVAAAVAGEAVGVDVETMRARDFSVWHRGWLRGDELRWLAQRGGQMADYYALWTLKEALLKAADLQFADLPQVGLCRVGGRWRLSADGRFWQGAVWHLGADIAAACVWRGQAYCVWQGVGAAAVQPVRLWFQAA